MFAAAAAVLLLARAQPDIGIAITEYVAGPAAGSSVAILHRTTAPFPSATPLRVTTPSSSWSCSGSDGGARGASQDGATALDLSCELLSGSAVNHTVSITVGYHNRSARHSYTAVPSALWDGPCSYTAVPSSALRGLLFSLTDSVHHHNGGRLRRSSTTSAVQPSCLGG